MAHRPRPLPPCSPLLHHLLRLLCLSRARPRTTPPSSHAPRCHLLLPPAEGLKSLQNSWKVSWGDFGKCTPAENAVDYLELGVQLDQQYPLVSCAQLAELRWQS